MEGKLAKKFECIAKVWRRWCKTLYSADYMALIHPLIFYQRRHDMFLPTLWMNLFLYSDLFPFCPLCNGMSVMSIILDFHVPVQNLH
jgi:hypothetical protein